VGVFHAQQMPSDCLECLIGATRVEVPLAEVERLLEYDAAPPPPLAAAWVGGIGVESAGHDDELFLSVSLRGSSTAQRRHAQGLLFKSVDGQARWVLEVDRVIGLRTIEREAELPFASDWACPPEWLRRARDPSGLEVCWFDVAAAERTLAGIDSREGPAA
jgi:hypothetical protein